VIRKRGRLGSIGGQKNGMRPLRSYAGGLVRSQALLGRDLSCGDTRIFLELEVRRLDCRNGGKVKREQLDFLRTIRTTPSALPVTLAGAVGLRRSRIVAADCCWIGIRSRPSTSSMPGQAWSPGNRNVAA
jgi:hypothetical protein